MAYYTKRSASKKITLPVAPAGPKPRIAAPSEYQQAIFDEVALAGQEVLSNFRSGISKIVAIHVDALAGCGKTSTTVEKDYYLPIVIRNDSISVAFNSNIAKELQRRVADGVSAKTIHSLGRAALVRAFPKLNAWGATYSKKYDGYIRAELGSEKKTMVARENLGKMIDRARDFLAWTAV